MSDIKEPKKEPKASSNTSYAKANRKKLISGLILLLASTAVVLSVFLSLGEIGDISNTFAQLWKPENYVDLIIAISMAVLYFALYPISLAILSHGMKAGVKFGDCYLIGHCEIFYNNITPAAIGGQPFQVFSLTKKKVPAGKATGLVLMNFATFLLAVDIFYLVSLFFFPQLTSQMDASHAWAKWLSLVFVILNVLFFFFVVALALSKRMSRALVAILKWLCKAKWINKLLGSKIESFQNYCDNAQNTAKELLSHKTHSLLAFLVRFVDECLYFAIPFFLIRAVGYKLDFVYLPFVMLATSFISAAVSWFPTPGTSGAVDYAFTLILSSVMAFAGITITGSLSGEAISLALLWRMLSYYLVLLFSLISVIIFEARYQRDMKKEIDALKVAESEEVEE